MADAEDMQRMIESKLHHI